MAKHAVAGLGDVVVDLQLYPPNAESAHLSAFTKPCGQFLSDQGDHAHDE
jgi:hypothetical protein